MRCLIIAGGNPPANALLQTQLKHASYVIGVDGAAAFLRRLAVVPDVLIGDFDSADMACVERLERAGARIIRLPQEKNETDTEGAVCHAIDAGADDIVLLGATGKRTDHTLANLSMLIRSERAGVRCRIMDGYNELRAVSGEYDLYGRVGQTVSILPLTADIRVNATNLKYPLENLLLCMDATRGISNIIEKSPAHLSISGGFALVAKIFGKA